MNDRTWFGKTQQFLACPVIGDIYKADILSLAMSHLIDGSDESACIVKYRYPIKHSVEYIQLVVYFDNPADIVYRALTAIVFQAHHLHVAKICGIAE